MSYANLIINPDKQEKILYPNKLISVGSYPAIFFSWKISTKERRIVGKADRGEIRMELQVGVRVTSRTTTATTQACSTGRGRSGL